MTTSQTAFGFPLVNARNILEVLAQRDIRPWTRLQEPIDLDAYRASDLTEAQRSELRFAPKTEVVQYGTPSGEPWSGFRSTLRDWATTFVLLPGDLTPIVGEWKHGMDGISLSPPSGAVTKTDADITAAAKREFKEETGIPLASIKCLLPDGVAPSGRSSAQRYFPHVGIVSEPIEPEPSSLDENEKLQLVMIPVSEWLKLLFAPPVIIEACAFDTTVRALRYLGRLDLLALVS